MSGIGARGRSADIGLLILRLVIGGVFIAHGAQKLFGFGPAGVAGMFGKMGVPLPDVTSVLVMAVELLAGLALVFGLLTRLAALGLAIDMLGVVLLVKPNAGFFGPMGMEFELTLLAGSLALMLTGAGAYSLDALRGRRRA